VVKSIVAIDGPPVRFRVGATRLRPYPGENTASRPISHSQAPESPVSIVVGDHTRILGAVIFFQSRSGRVLFFFSPVFTQFLIVHPSRFSWSFAGPPRRRCFFEPRPVHPGFLISPPQWIVTALTNFRRIIAQADLQTQLHRLIVTSSFRSILSPELTAFIDIPAGLHYLLRGFTVIISIPTDHQCTYSLPFSSQVYNVNPSVYLLTSVHFSVS
jgi:hypothetical protein